MKKVNVRMKKVGMKALAFGTCLALISANAAFAQSPETPVSNQGSGVSSNVAEPYYGQTGTSAGIAKPHYGNTGTTPSSIEPYYANNSATSNAAGNASSAPGVAEPHYGDSANAQDIATVQILPAPAMDMPVSNRAEIEGQVYPMIMPDSSGELDNALEGLVYPMIMPAEPRLQRENQMYHTMDMPGVENEPTYHTMDMTEAGEAAEELIYTTTNANGEVSPGEVQTLTSQATASPTNNANLIIAASILVLVIALGSITYLVRRMRVAKDQA